MDRKKKINSAKNRLGVLIIFLYVLIFPLGQLLRSEHLIMGRFVVVQPIEVLCFPLTLMAIFKMKSLIKRFPNLVTFIASLFFSLVLSFSLNDLRFVLIGLFYLLRVVNFVGVFYGAYLLRIFFSKKLLMKVMVFFGITTLIFGFSQYFAYPDLRHLKYTAWDDHVFRVVGTFLDPGFTGLLLALATILGIDRLIEKNTVGNIFLSILFLVGTLFTYSRSSYLALIAGTIVIIYYSKYSLKKLLFIGFPLFFAFMLILPRPGGEGVKLERMFSINARIRNYQQAYKIWEQSPVFGIGFNNLCSYRLRASVKERIESHSCSGSDSSIMMLLATSGILGVITFITAFKVNLDKFGKLKNNKLLYASLTAVFVHSFFTNSLFYPWVVGWIAFAALYTISDNHLGRIVDS